MSDAACLRWRARGAGRCRSGRDGACGDGRCGSDAYSVGEALSLTDTDIEVMVVLPDAANHLYTGDGGQTMAMLHEMGHVATLYNDSQDSGYDSFIEGIAEYMTYAGHPSWDDLRLADTREYVREAKWSGQCYLTKEISSSVGLTGSAAHVIG